MENFSLIAKTEFFKNIDEKDVQAMCHCFNIRFRNYNKNNIIIGQGAPLEDVFLILKGSAMVGNFDSQGESSVLMKLKAGDEYGLVQACSGKEIYLNNVIACENTLVMIISKYRLLNPCQNRCPRHLQIIKNILKIVASNSDLLLDKISHLQKKKIRDKVLSYLKLQSKKQASSYFDIPFNKTELAEYLSVDRSALSSELNKLKAEGIIDFDKKRYHIKKDEVDL